MTVGYHDPEKGHVEGPLDDRDEVEPDFEVDPYLSCSNTDFGGRDPAEDEGEVATFDVRSDEA